MRKGSPEASAPAKFRNSLRIEVEGRGLIPFHSCLQPWQERDFSALDPAWERLAGDDRHVPYQRAYLERPRGHSKTTDLAMHLAWVLLFGSAGLTGLAAAADKEQAALLLESLLRLSRWNERVFPDLQFLKDAVINRKTKSRLNVITSDVASSWGVLPDFVICDELCHWSKSGLWYSLLSSAAKKPNCVLVVLTNAGFGRDWQWNVRENARLSPGWYFSSLDGPQAPWIREDRLQEQRQMLPRPVFERLWLNRWQHSDGEFVTLAEAEACRDESLVEQAHGQPYQDYVAAIDYAEKHDLSVGVLIHREGRNLIVDRMDVRKPSPDCPTPVQWVEDWMHFVAREFPRVTFVIDEYQLVGTIQRFEPLYDLRRFEFASGRGNHALAIALRRMILQRQVRWYPGCGQLPDSDGRDDLETELASLLLKQRTGGLCRIMHHEGGSHHDDRSFVLGAALLHALTQSNAPEWIEIRHPGFH
jgi:hypothetical protein